MNALDPQRPTIVTHARVLAIAVPMTLSNATTPLLGVVATAVIGRLGQAHLLGAVAMSSVVFDCLFWLFAFLRMGTVALTAQALGAGDVAEERATLIRALLVAAAIGLALIVLQVPLGAVIYRLMGASAEVTARRADLFLRAHLVRAVRDGKSRAARLVRRARARHRPRSRCRSRSTSSIWRVTCLLVLWLDFGVAGAAFGAVVAEAFGTVAGLVLAFRIVGARMPDMARIFDRERLVRLFVVNRDIFIRTAMLIFAWGFFAAQGARVGRRAARGELGAAQSGAGRRVLPRRVRVGRRAAVRPCDRRARRPRILALGEPCACSTASHSASRRR